MKNNMTFENLFILAIIPQLWLRKIISSAIGLLIVYPIILYNRESAFLLSLLFSTFVYKKLQKINVKNLKNKKDANAKEDNKKPQSKDEKINDKISQTTSEIIDPPSGIIDQFIAGLFCICLVVFIGLQDFLIKACLSIVFINIYDYYKPSLIGKLYVFDKDRILGFVLGGILNGVLSGISVMLCVLLFDRAFGYLGNL